jgi:hypothetical protein
MACENWWKGEVWRGNGRERNWIAKQDTPPVPCVRTVIPLRMGVGPKKRQLMAVGPAADNVANSSNER